MCKILHFCNFNFRKKNLNSYLQDGIPSKCITFGMRLRPKPQIMLYANQLHSEHTAGLPASLQILESCETSFLFSMIFKFYAPLLIVSKNLKSLISKNNLNFLKNECSLVGSPIMISILEGTFAYRGELFQLGKAFNVRFGNRAFQLVVRCSFCFCK